MVNNEIFEVTRSDYKAFVERIIAGAGHTVTEKYEGKVEIKLFSNKTDKCWCSRVKIGEEPEKYYIFEYPDEDEWGPPIPKMRITLETQEEVQALFDALSELRRQHEND